MDNYFVVLQLPENREFKLSGHTNNPENFWGKAAAAIALGKAKIVSRRNDTGVSEELQSYVKREDKFKTYVLLNMYLNKREAKSAIFKKAASCLNGSSQATVIDASEKFALITAGG